MQVPFVNFKSIWVLFILSFCFVEKALDTYDLCCLCLGSLVNSLMKPQGGIMHDLVTEMQVWEQGLEPCKPGKSTGGRTLFPELIPSKQIFASGIRFVVRRSMGTRSGTGFRAPGRLGRCRGSALRLWEPFQRAKSPMVRAKSGTVRTSCFSQSGSSIKP